MVLFRDYYRGENLSVFPPTGAIARLMTKVLLYLFLAASFYALCPYEYHDIVMPGGTLFSIFLLYLFSETFGVLTKQLLFLPSLVGMIFAGIFVSNLTFFKYHVDHHTSSSLRNIAFIALLVRAGLELDTESLLKMKRVCILLSFVPGVMAESPVVAITAKLFLGLPWGWAFMIGFIMAAVSPAIVVACILKLQDKGYGTEKGIPTLVIASSSVDDIVAICCFSVAMTVTFATGSVAWVVSKAPIEFVAGATPGALLGMLFWFLPSSSDNHKVYLRYSLLFLGSISAFFGAEHLKAHGAGALFVITVGFVASRRWNKGTPFSKTSHDDSSLSGHSCANDVEDVEKVFAISWRYLAPLLFGLIGAELKLKDLDWGVIGLALVIVTLGVLARLGAAYICCFGVGLTWKEKLFVAISSIPKATVQAAIGSVPLDYVRQLSDSEREDGYEEWARKILAIAVVSVILTAPLGAVLTKVSGRHLLDRNTKSKSGIVLKDSPEDEKDQDEELGMSNGSRPKKGSVHEERGQKIMEKFSEDNHVEV